MKYIFELNHPKHYYQFNFIMLQETYGMLFNIADPDDAIKKAEELASQNHKTEWQQKREKYYAHTGDINATITNLLTNL